MSDMPSCFREIERKARKDHKCTNCGAVIEKGEFYTYISGIWDGDPGSYKHCKNCKTVCENFKEMDSGLGFEDGPTLDRGGISCWMQDFTCQSYKGMDAAIDISKRLGVPLCYVKKQLCIEDESQESESV